MKLSINTQRLKKVLKFIAPISNGKNPIPILSHIKIYADKDSGKAIFYVSDLKTSIVISVDADVHESGVVFAEGDAFNKLINTLFDDNILLSSKNNGVHVDVVSGKFTLSAVDSSDIEMFPDISIDYESDTKILSLPFHIVCNPLKKALGYVSKDEIRPMLCGVNINPQQNGFYIEATDAHRLYRDYIEYECLEGVRLPSDFVKTITSVPATDNSTIDIYNIGNSKIAAIIGNTTIISPMIEGKFPNVDAVIPKSYKNNISVNKNELLNAVKRCLITSNGTTKLIKMNISSPVTISSDDVDFNRSGSETLLHGGTIDTQMTVGFNGSLLSEILSTVDSDYINIRVLDPSKAVLFYCEDNDNVVNMDTTMLLMPAMTN